MAKYENGLPIVGQPRAKNAFAQVVILTDEMISGLREALANADAENKAEVCIAYNDKIALFTFESFLALIFPPESTGQVENPTNKTEIPV